MSIDGVFLKNKYYNWYCQIIERARNRESIDSSTERHHVLPKCMGGKDGKSNRVALTYREHFIAHWLLTKCVTGKNKRKMQLALAMMGRVSALNKNRIVSSWQFAIARKNSQLGHRGYSPSAETRKKISLANKGFRLSKAQRLHLSEKLKGIPLSEERRAKMRWFSPTRETREKLRAALKGRKRPIEVIEKIRQSHLLLNQKRREERELI